MRAATAKAANANQPIAAKETPKFKKREKPKRKKKKRNWKRPKRHRKKNSNATMATTENPRNDSKMRPNAVAEKK